MTYSKVIKVKRKAKAGGKQEEKSKSSEAGVNPLVQRVSQWRTRNGLSQRQAAAVLGKWGVPVAVTTIQQWEQGRRAPSRLVGKLLEGFLGAHEKEAVKDAPVFVKGTPSRLSEADVAEMHRLREEGQTLAAIGTRFGVDESYISRIIRGERLKVPL